MCGFMCVMVATLNFKIRGEGGGTNLGPTPPRSGTYIDYVLRLQISIS